MHHFISQLEREIINSVGCDLLFLPPYSPDLNPIEQFWANMKQKKRELISATPKFYLFDGGVANILIRRHIEEIKGDIAGQMLEHYIFTEIIAFKGLNDLDFDLSYWRTNNGLEVDFIISGSA